MPETVATHALAGMRRGGGAGISKAAMLLAIAVALVGYLVFADSGKAILFHGGCALLTLACLHHAISSLFQARLNIGSIIASQSMLWYAMPFSYIGFFGHGNYIFQVSEIENAQSVALVILVSSLVYVWFERFAKPIKLHDVAIDWRSYAPLIVPIMLAQAYLIATGDRGYANVSGVYNPEREESLLYQFTRGFAPAVMPMCMAALAVVLRAPTRTRSMLGIAVCVFGLFIQFMWWTTAGRRYMTIIGFVSMVSFFAIYFRGRLNQRRVMTIIAAALVGIPALGFLWEVYYLLRVATDVSGGLENLSILDISKARALASASNFDNSFAENLIYRPLSIATSLSIVRDTASGFLWGWNLVSQALLTVPSAFFPGKFDFIGSTLETLWSEALGVPLTDYSNTIFIESYIDFGLAGFPIYVAIIATMARITYRIGRLCGDDTLNSFIYFNLAFWVLNVETTTNSIFVCFRSVATVVLIYIVCLLFRRRRRSSKYSSVASQ